MSLSLPQWWKIDPCVPFQLGPRKMPGRIWTASGCFAYGLTGHEISAPGFESPYQGIGAVVTKTVTPHPRGGNPMPRLAETGVGAINSIGLENVGFEEFCEVTLPALEALAVPTVVSLAASEPDEFEAFPDFERSFLFLAMLFTPRRCLAAPRNVTRIGDICPRS